jgi:hypothetical protein
MSITLRSLFAPALIVAFAAGQAQASALILQFDGLTVGSTLNAIPIANGTPFEIQADFVDVPVTQSTGVAQYALLAISADIGGITYYADAASVGGAFLELIDPSSGLIVNYSPLFALGGAFGPEYTTATPLFSATAPTPTVFSGYDAIDNLGGTSVSFTAISLDVLQLGYDQAAGIDASITGIPEPGTLALLGAGLLAVWRLRRRQAR